MTEHWKNDNFCISKEKIMPIQIKYHKDIDNADELLIEKTSCISFQLAHCAEFKQKGAFIVLDFGKELWHLTGPAVCVWQMNSEMWFSFLALAQANGCQPWRQLFDE